MSTINRPLLVSFFVMSFVAGAANASNGPGGAPGTLSSYAGADGTSVTVYQNTGTGNVNVEITPDYRDALYDNTFIAEVWTIGTPTTPSDRVTTGVTFSPGNTPPITIGPGQEVRVVDDPFDSDSLGTKGTVLATPF